MRVKTSLYVYLLCAIFTALTVVCAQIMVPLPFTPVPINLTLLAVFASGGVLGPKRGAVAILVYLLLGVIGVPVFSGLQGGLGVLAGPNGGFIIGYVLVAFVYGYFYRISNDTKRTASPALPTALKFLKTVALGLPAIAVCYATGTVWFVISTGTEVWASLLMCVIPFIPGDLLKLVAASTVSKLFKNPCAPSSKPGGTPKENIKETRQSEKDS